MSEAYPSLHIYRRVINVSDRTLGNLTAHAQEAGVPIPAQQGKGLFIDVSDPNEFYAATKHTDIRGNRDQVDVTGDKILEYLPDVCFDNIEELPKLPIRNGLSPFAPRSGQTVLFGEVIKQVERDRLLVQSLSKAIIGKADLNWQAYDYINYKRIRFGEFKQDRDAAKVGKFIGFLNQNIDLLPNAMVLGPLEMESV